MRVPFGRALTWGLGLVLLAVVVGAVVAPQHANVALQWQWTVPTIAVVLLAALLARVPRWLKGPWVPGALAVATTVLAASIGLALRYRYGWDAKYVMGLARAVADGEPVPAGGYGYLSMFPNNLSLVAIDRVAIQVSGALGVSPDTLLICVGAVGVGLTGYAVHGLVRPVAGAGPAVVSQLLVAALVGTSPWLSVPYTDVLALPLTTAAAALTAAALRRSSQPGARRWALAGAATVLAAAAYVVKTTTVVLTVAGLLTALLVVLGSGAPLRRRMAGALLVAGLGGGLFGAGVLVLGAGTDAASGVDLARVDRDLTPPTLWWVALGMAQQSSANGHPGYGGYSRELVEAVRGKGQSAADAYARDFIERRWRERGLAGTAEFYARKTVWNWEDGMFSAWLEGYDSRPGAIIGTSGATLALERVNGPQGALYPQRAQLTSGLWLGLLLVIALGLVRARPRPEVVLLALTVLGIGAFTLVFQGRSRYLFVFVPVVVSLTGMVAGLLPRPRRRRDGRASQLIAPPSTLSTAARPDSSPERVSSP